MVEGGFEANAALMLIRLLRMARYFIFENLCRVVP